MHLTTSCIIYQPKKKKSPLVNFKYCDSFLSKDYILSDLIGLVSTNITSGGDTSRSYLSKSKLQLQNKNNFNSKNKSFRPSLSNPKLGFNNNIFEINSEHFIDLLNKWIKEPYNVGQSDFEKKNKKEFYMPVIHSYFQENDLNFASFSDSFISFYNSFLKEEKIKKFYGFTSLKTSKTIHISRKPLKNKESISV